MDKNKRFNPYVSVDAEEEIVISGIAGRFPNSDNINEFQKNIFNKMDLGSEDHQRWTNCNNIFFSKLVISLFLSSKILISRKIYINRS